MKFGFLIIVLIFSTTSAFNQVFIRGKVTDGQTNLLSATVLLLTDSVLVKGVITNENGEYIFDGIVSGKYRISASMVGYTKFLSKEIIIGNENMMLENFQLEEIATELNEIVVMAEKPMFEQQPDRLVVNVQSSITASGNSILEVLQKSPGILVNRQNNSISMNGKSGVKVMVNGKIMQLPLDVVVQMLDGMNSSNVEKIELITSPAARYDADGNAGIINIVMKGNDGIGTNGSIGATLGAHWAETLGASLNLNHRDQRFAYVIDYSVLRNHNLHSMFMNKQSYENDFEQQVFDNSHRENVTTQQNINAGFEWKLNKRTTLNVDLTSYKRKWDLNARTRDENYMTPDSTIITNMRIDELNVWQSATAAIGLSKEINLKNRIGLNVDYLAYHNSNPSRYDSDVLYEQLGLVDDSKIKLEKNTPIQFAVVRSDYQYVHSQFFTLEAGVKTVFSALSNDVIVQRAVNNSWVEDPVFSSYSRLHEQIGAAYLSTTYKAKNQWRIISGLRYEYTHTLISTSAQRNLINRKYGYLFPSLSLEKTLAVDKGYQISYTRRLTRPTYNDMAPYVFFWGPHTFSSGNVALLPSISDAIKFGYHLKQWMTSLQFTHIAREISFLQPEKDQSNNMIFRSQNLKYLNSIGLTNSYSFNLSSWWEMQGSLTAQYQVAETAHLEHNVTLPLYGLNINVTNAIRLPKNYSIEISGLFQSKSLSGISVFLPLGALNAGLQKKVGHTGILRFSMDDILNTNNWRIKTDVQSDNLHSYFNYNWHNRFFRFTYTRNFGNHKLNAIKLKSNSDEERRRISN